MKNETELKEWLFISWREGSIGSYTSEEDDREAFEEWYETQRERILADFNGKVHKRSVQRAEIGEH